MLLQRLGGFFTIVVAVAVLAGVSTFDPPVAVQIILALVGSFICLIGVVLAFSEGKISRKGKKA
jgi:archaellum biogenesis protein FlaJ (TadC family)